MIRFGMLLAGCMTVSMPNVSLADSGLFDEARLESKGVSVYVPAFVSSAGSLLGLNASTVIDLGLWRTLRRSSAPNRFGSGTIIWSPKVADYVFPFANLTLNGEAFPYGSGAIVTSRLRVNSVNMENQAWKISITLPDKRQLGLELDIFPERSFEFKSVPLEGSDLDQYSAPGVLDVHRGNSHGPIIGRTGGSFRALEQDISSAHVVTRSGLDGYLALPPFQSRIGAIVYFTGGVVRMLRTDWSGAIDLFAKSRGDLLLPTSLAIDADLMSAYCTEKLGTDGEALVNRALTVSRSSPRSNKYMVMVIFSEIARRIRSGDYLAAKLLLPRLKKSVDTASSLLGADDNWIMQCRDVVGILNDALR